MEKKKGRKGLRLKMDGTFFCVLKYVLIRSDM